MTPIIAAQNPYPGPNPHALSWWLNARLWEVFHQRFIGFLSDEINAKLPPGYFAYPDKGIQLEEKHPKTGKTIRSHPRQPDSAVFKTPGSPSGSSSSTNRQAPSLTLSPMEVLDLTDPSDASASIGLYKARSDENIGDLVAWVEVLSPTNKLPEDPNDKSIYARTGYEAYRKKREQILGSGLPLAEIDLIHQQPPVTPRLGIYPEDNGTSPYSIIVIDPRPSLEKGLATIYQFGVGSAFPLFDIPLDDAQRASGIDLLAPFNESYARLPTDRIDYDQFPLRSETYGRAEQEQIAAQIGAMRQLSQAGYTFKHGWPAAVPRRPLIEAVLNQLRAPNQPTENPDRPTLKSNGER
ncbi:MAG: DUF4058 family protein [Aggregatilineales bacterium]